MRGICIYTKASVYLAICNVISSSSWWILFVCAWMAIGLAV